MKTLKNNLKSLKESQLVEWFQPKFSPKKQNRQSEMPQSLKSLHLPNLT
jgi:hypothetical protein